jgi:hypothetical protein
MEKMEKTKMREYKDYLYRVRTCSSSRDGVG